MLSRLLTEENHYWIGLKDSGDDHWFWINNNETVETRNEIWHVGEPNNYYMEDCAEVSKRSSGVKANDENCEYGYYGICEKPDEKNG